MSKFQQFINYIADPRARRSIRSLFTAGGYTTKEVGSSIPATGIAGYAPGCEFILPEAALGQCPTWRNIGSATSSLFVPVGPVLGYGVNIAGGPIDCTNGSTTLTIAQDLVIDTDLMLAGHVVSDDNDQIVSVKATASKNNAVITASADPLVAHDYIWAALRNKCVPAFDIFAAGTHTTVGGAAAEAITVTGVAAGDRAFANYSATDDTDVISDVLCSANTVTVTCSADPSTTHGLHYVVLRPRGSFKPSHYIAYAGSHTTVGGAAAEAITVTGALSTDIPIVNYNTTNDTDSILKAVATANTLTVTASADPSTAHAFTYMLLRAY